MSQDSVHKPQLLKIKESRSGIEPRSFRLPALHLTARPNRLIEMQSDTRNRIYKSNGNLQDVIHSCPLFVQSLIRSDSHTFQRCFVFVLLLLLFRRYLKVCKQILILIHLQTVLHEGSLRMFEPDESHKQCKAVKIEMVPEEILMLKICSFNLSLSLSFHCMHVMKFTSCSC